MPDRSRGGRPPARWWWLGRVCALVLGAGSPRGAAMAALPRDAGSGLSGPPPASLAEAARRLRPAPPLPPVRPAVVTHGRRDQDYIALTFDACETRRKAGFDRRIVAILCREQVPATLFLGGHWMWSHPAETQALRRVRRPSGRALFELGNHSFLHGHFPHESLGTIRRELALTQAVAFALTGQQGHVARAPYGEYTPGSVKVAAALGLTLIQWDLVTGDPDPHVRASAIVRTVRQGARPGSIIIMHLNGRGQHTAEALPQVIAALRRRGLEFVTVSELLARFSASTRQPPIRGKKLTPVSF